MIKQVTLGLTDDKKGMGHKFMEPAIK